MDAAGYYCIADEDTVRGFRAVGVRGEVVLTAPAAASALAAACARDDVGIVILAETVADLIRPQVDEIRLHRSRPLIAEIPGPDGRRPGHPDLRRQVQSAAGFTLEWKEPIE